MQFTFYGNPNSFSSLDLHWICRVSMDFIEVPIEIPSKFSPSSLRLWFDDFGFLWVLWIGLTFGFVGISILFPFPMWRRIPMTMGKGIGMGMGMTILMPIVIVHRCRHLHLQLHLYLHLDVFRFI